MKTLTAVWVLLIPFVGIFLVVGIHWLLARWIKNRHWVIIVGAFALVSFWVCFKTWQSASDSVMGWFDGLCYTILNFVIFAGLSYGYFTLINLNITALRIRLLRIMYQYPDDWVPETALTKEYHPVAVMQHRIHRLEKMGQIHCDAKGCVLRRKELVYLALAIQTIRKWLNITPVV